jgi:hypothetical protein
MNRAPRHVSDGRKRRARLDPDAQVRVVDRTALRFSATVAKTVGTGWVRAGSSLVRFGKRLALIQDDALWLAWLDVDGELQAESLTTDASGERLFDDKRKKPDFEAAVAIPGVSERLLVFGSGGLASRERVAVLSEGQAVRLVEATELYASLRRELAFVGAQVNIEGAFVDGGRLVLCSRGNGARSADSTDATVELPLTELVAYLDAPLTTSVPRLGQVEQYQLGQIDGVSLTLTDAAFHHGQRYYVAAAEASADAIADGPVHGVSLGVLSEDPHYALIEDESGGLLREKVEGLTPVPDSDDWLAIVDADDVTKPSTLLRLRCHGL